MAILPLEDTMSKNEHRPHVNIAGREGQNIAIASRVAVALSIKGMEEESMRFRREAFEAGYINVKSIASKYVTLDA
jgi:hypothetical protein